MRILNYKKIFILLLILSFLSLNSEISYAKSSDKKETSKMEVMDEEDEEENFEDRVKMSLGRMGSTNYSNVEQAIFFFETMGEDAVPYLIEKLEKEKENKRVVNNVIYTIGRLGKNAKRSVPSLLNFLKNSDSDIRGVTVVALGKIGQDAKSAIPALILLLKDRDSWVQSKASEALKKIDGKIK